MTARRVWIRKLGITFIIYLCIEQPLGKKLLLSPNVSKRLRKDLNDCLYGSPVSAIPIQFESKIEQRVDVQYQLQSVNGLTSCGAYGRNINKRMHMKSAFITRRATVLSQANKSPINCCQINEYYTNENIDAHAHIIIVTTAHRSRSHSVSSTHENLPLNSLRE